MKLIVNSHIIDIIIEKTDTNPNTSDSYVYFFVAMLFVSSSDKYRNYAVV